ncbi:MAG: hypothetical protein NC388_06610 [Clostridium sp.]|nr:hypothetical protein [Clostridium sp.]
MFMKYHAILHRSVCTSLTLIALFGLQACDGTDDEDITPYPALLTEMGDLPSDMNSTVSTFHCDNGTVYTLEQPIAAGTPNAVYRQLCTFESVGSIASPVARVYSLTAVRLLRDSTERPQAADPTTVTSAWRGGSYINLMISPRTQGGTQYWGYRTDSLRILNGNRRCLYLSLHHNANGDPSSYTTTVYASIPLDELKQIQPGDSVVVKAHQPTGVKAWGFTY